MTFTSKCYSKDYKVACIGSGGGAEKMMALLDLWMRGRAGEWPSLMIAIEEASVSAASMKDRTSGRRPASMLMQSTSEPGYGLRVKFGGGRATISAGCGMVM